jgi:hypothetical protein
MQQAVPAGHRPRILAQRQRRHRLRQPDLNLPEREIVTPSRKRSELPTPTRDLDPKREISLEDD